MEELPAKMTSMVEHQSAKGCFREKGREPGRDDNMMLDDKLTMMMIILPLARSSLTARQQRAA